MKSYYRKLAERRVAKQFASTSGDWLSEGGGKGIVKFFRYNGGPLEEGKPTPEELRWRELLANLPDNEFEKLCGQLWPTCSECGEPL
jgi:hypothetical protein